MAKVKSKITDPRIIEALSVAATSGVNLTAGPSDSGVSVSTAPTTGVLIERPAEAIQAGGAKFNELYQRYTTLRELARPLNGLSQAAILPDGVRVSKVTLDFSVNGVDHTVNFDTVRNIGEIAPMLTVALRTTIEHMSQELFTMTHLVNGMQKSIQQALAIANKPTDVSLETKTDEKAV